MTVQSECCEGCGVVEPDHSYDCTRCEAHLCEDCELDHDCEDNA